MPDHRQEVQCTRVPSPNVSGLGEERSPLSPTTLRPQHLHRQEVCALQIVGVVEELPVVVNTMARHWRTPPPRVTKHGTTGLGLSLGVAEPPKGARDKTKSNVIAH